MDSPAPLPTKRNAGPSAGDANTVALLSLKLVLLAFFLLLVSLSSLQERKVMLVIESVNDVFDGKIKSRLSHPVFESALEELDGAKETSAEIARLFRQHLPASRVDPLDQGQKLRVAVELDLLFGEGQSRFRVGPGLLLDRLVGLTQQRPSLANAHVSVQLAAPRAGATTQEPFELSARRLAVLAQAFVKRGLSAERVSAGFGAVPDGELWIVIENINGAAAAR